MATSSSRPIYDSYRPSNRSRRQSSSYFSSNESNALSLLAFDEDAHRDSSYSISHTSGNKPGSTQANNGRDDNRHVTPTHSAHSPPRSFSETQGSRSKNVGVFTKASSCCVPEEAVMTHADKLSNEANTETQHDNPSTSTFFKDLLQSMVKQAVLQDRVEQHQLRFDAAQTEEERLRKTYPDRRASRDYGDSLLKTYKDEMNRLTTLIAEADNTQQILLKSSPQFFNDLFQGVNPCSRHQSDDITPLATARIEHLEKELRKLDQQYTAKEKELKQLRTVTEENQQQLVDVRADLERLFDKLGDNQDVLDQHSKQISNHEERIVRCSEMCSSLQVLQRRPAQTLVGPEIERDISDLKTATKEYKDKITNIANQFVSSKEFTGYTQNLTALKRSQTQSFEDLKMQLDEIGSTERDHYALLSRDLQSLRSAHIFGDWREVQSSVKTLNERFEQHLQSVTASSTFDSVNEKLRQLEKAVGVLTVFHGDYEKFHHNTEGVLETTRKELSLQDAALRELSEQHNVLREEHDKLLNLTNLNSNLNDHDSQDFNTKMEFLLDAGFVTSRQVETELNTRFEEMDNKYNDFSLQMNTSLQPAIKASVANTLSPTITQLKGELDLLKQKQTDLITAAINANHSIESLSSRYNSISTKYLHKAIVASIQPQNSMLDSLAESSKQFGARLEELEQTFQNRHAHLHGSEAGDHDHPTQSNRTLKESELAAETQGTTEMCRTLARSVVALQIAEAQKCIDQLMVIGRGTSPNADDLSAICDAGRQTCDELSKDLDAPACLTNDTFLSTQTRIVALQDSLNKTRQSRLGSQGSFNPSEDLRTLGIGMLEVSKRLEAIETSISKEKVQTLSSSKRSPNLCERAKSDATDVSNTIVDLEELVYQLQDKLANLAAHYFSPKDKYVKVKHLSSKVDHAYIRKKFPKDSVRNVWFYGTKISNNPRATRYALVQVDGNKMASIINNYNGQRWKNRDIEVTAADIGTIRHVLMDDCGPVEKLARFDNVLAEEPSANNSVNSTQAETIADEDPDTIVVDTTQSSSFPRDESNYLTGWIEEDKPSESKSHSESSIVSINRSSTAADLGTTSVRPVKRRADDLQHSYGLSRSKHRRTQ